MRCKIGVKVSRYYPYIYWYVMMFRLCFHEQICNWLVKGGFTNAWAEFILIYTVLSGLRCLGCSKQWIIVWSRCSIDSKFGKAFLPQLLICKMCVYSCLGWVYIAFTQFWPVCDILSASILNYFAIQLSQKLIQCFQKFCINHHFGSLCNEK